MTARNSHSSRSHGIFQIRLVSRNSTLTFVELAGSESIRNTNADGLRIREAGFINQSLLSLKRVIQVMVDIEVRKRKE